MKYLTTLNDYTTRNIQRLILFQKAYYTQLSEILASGNYVMPKTMKRRVNRASKILQDLETEYMKKIKGDEKDLYKMMFKMNLEDIGKKADFSKVNWSRYKLLEETNLKFLKNYSDDIQRKLKIRLQLALLNKESYFTVYEDIKGWLVGKNSKAKPKIVIRDQMARLSQEAILESYKTSGRPDMYDYYWVGPDDARTSDICKERKRNNPYSWEEAKNLSMHPHINCRHRLVAKPKENKNQ